MVAVSHAPDLKAANPKTPTPHPAAPAPAKSLFQTLIDQHAKSVHAETGEKTKVSRDKAEKSAPEKLTLDKAEKLTKVAKLKTEAPSPRESHKADKDPGDVNVNAVAALLAPQPELRAEPANGNANSNTAKPVKDKIDARAVSTDSSALPLLAKLEHGVRPQRVEGAEDRPKVTVVDRRSDSKEKEKEKLKAEASQTQALAVSDRAPVQIESVSKSDAAPEVRAVFHHSEGTFDLKPQATVPAPRDAVTFQQYLVDKGYGQLVEQARFVLKDNNAGEIRMTLHPESLGKVKVALNLSDGSLAGQIFVENQTVKDVFQANMDGLLQAFRDSGWNDLNLQVSVGGDQNRQQSETSQSRDYGRQVVQTAGTSETAVEGRISAWNGQVNLTA